MISAVGGGLLTEILSPSSTWMAPAELPSLAGVKRLCPDVETRDENLRERGPGFVRGESYIVGLGLGTDDGRRMYFPVRHDGGGNLDPGKVREWFKYEAARFDGELCNAHLLYDLEALAADWGVTFPNVRGYHDPLLADTLIDEWLPNYSLEAAGQRWLGEGKVHTLLYEAAAAHGWTDDGAVKRNLWRLHARYVGPYAEGDVDRPLRIIDRQLVEIEKQGLGEVYDVERGLIPLLLAMRLRGVRFDGDAAERARVDLTARRDAYLAEARRLASSSKIELMAPESFAQKLTDRGLTFPLTKTGKPSITKLWLKANQSDKLVTAIVGGRRLDKVINTFIDGTAQYAHKGRIYPQFPQLKQNRSEDDDEEGSSGTIARFACRMPNLQFQPARDKEIGPLIRGFFIPDEEEDWERNDLSQIEFRLLVHFAIGDGADEARRKYNEDQTTDFHNLAGEMFGADLTDDYERGRIKSTNFCKVYMGGDSQLANTIGCSLPEAKEFSRRYDRELPFVHETAMKAMRSAEQHGYVLDVLNRRQRFDLWEERDAWRKYKDKRERKKAMLPYDEAVAAYGDGVVRAFVHAGLNRKLQASAASVFKKSLKDIYEAGICQVLGAPLINVHDENNWSVPRTREADEAAAEARWHMENSVKLSVPLRVDWKRGANWGLTK